MYIYIYIYTYIYMYMYIYLYIPVGWGRAWHGVHGGVRLVDLDGERVLVLGHAQWGEPHPRVRRHLDQG